MITRLARSADALDLSRLHTASFREGWTEDDFVTWLGRDAAIAVVAEEGGDVVAFGLALAAGEDAELLTIATRPDLRGKGLGRRIMRALDEEAMRRGLQRWVLEVARNNLAALRLYSSEGFVEIGVRKAYYPDETGRIDALVMSRPVTPQGGQVRA
ncbi:MAG: ribosomal protein S18-alanine N-acetyltransferase [Hyphomonadaceae bacterium]